MSVIVLLLVILVATPAQATFEFFRPDGVRGLGVRREAFRTKHGPVIYCEMVSRPLTAIVLGEYCCSTEPTECADIVAQEFLLKDDPMALHEFRLQYQKDNPQPKD